VWQEAVRSSPFFFLILIVSVLLSLSFLESQLADVLFFSFYLFILRLIKSSNAIEEELEVLYDAYYEELEQYANYQQRYLNSGGASTPPPGPGPFPGSVELDKNGAVVSPAAIPTTKRSARQKVQTRDIQQNGKKQPQQRTRPHPQHHPPEKDSEFDDDGEEDEEYEAEEEEEEEEEEEDELDGDEDEDEEEDEDDVQPRRRVANGSGAKPDTRPAAGARNPPARNDVGRDGVLNIGNSLTVTGKQYLQPSRFQ
jgi:Ca2+/Na+ antiporter